MFRDPNVRPAPTRRAPKKRTPTTPNVFASPVVSNPIRALTKPAPVRKAEKKLPPPAQLPVYPLKKRYTPRERKTISQGITRAVRRQGASPAELLLHPETRQRLKPFGRVVHQQQQAADRKTARGLARVNGLTVRQGHALLAAQRSMQRNAADVHHPGFAENLGIALNRTPLFRDLLTPLSSNLGELSTQLERYGKAKGQSIQRSLHGSASDVRGGRGSVGALPLGFLRAPTAGILDLAAGAAPTVARLGAGALNDATQFTVGAVPAMAQLTTQALEQSPGAAAGSLVKGLEQVALHPKDHPLFFLQLLHGGVRAAGRTSGAVARSGVLGKSVRRAASTERAPLSIGGPAARNLVEYRHFSKDLIVKGLQVLADRGLQDGPTVRYHGRSVVSKAAKDSKLASMLGRDVAGRLRSHGDFIADRANAVERANRAHMLRDLARLMPTRAHRGGAIGRFVGEGLDRTLRAQPGGRRILPKRLYRPERDVVGLGVSRVVRSARTFESDLRQELARVERRGKQPFDTPEERAANKARQTTIKRVLEDPKALANAKRTMAAADQLARRGKALTEEAVSQGALSPEAAARAPLFDYAISHMGAKYVTADEHKALEAEARQAERKAAERVAQLHGQVRETQRTAAGASNIEDALHAAGLPKDLPIHDDRALSLLASGRWTVRVKKTTHQDTYGGPMHTLEIRPKAQPGVKEVKWEKNLPDAASPGGKFNMGERSVMVDQRVAKVTGHHDDGSPIIEPKPGYLGHDEALKHLLKPDPNALWRGISQQELDYIRANGHIQSDGSYNMGESQKGVTMFAAGGNPGQANSYAAGFSPRHLQPTFGEPGYIIKIRRPANARPDPSVREEIQVPGKVPASEIVDLIEVRPMAMQPGEMDLTTGKFYGDFGPNADKFRLGGGRTAEGQSYAYKRVPLKAPTKDEIAAAKREHAQAREHRIQVSGRPPELVKRHEAAKARAAQAERKMKQAQAEHARAHDARTRLLGSQSSRRGRRQADALGEDLTTARGERPSGRATPAERRKLEKANANLRLAKAKRDAAEAAYREARDAIPKLPEPQAGLRRGGGEYLSNAEIHAHMRDVGKVPTATSALDAKLGRAPEGEPLVAYLPHRPDETGRASYHRAQALLRRDSLEGYQRTGAAFKKGITGSSYNLVADHLVRMGITTGRGAIGQFDSLVRDAGVKDANGRLFTPREAELRAANLSNVPGQPKLVPVRVFGARLSPEQQALIRSLQDPVSLDGSAFGVHRDLEHYMEKALGDRLDMKKDRGARNVVLMPEELVNRFEEHMKATAGRSPLGALVARGFRTAVLPFSAKWLVGNVAEAVLRLAIIGANPLDYAAGRKTVRALAGRDAKTIAGRQVLSQIIGLDALRAGTSTEVRASLLGGLFYGERGLTIRRDSHDFEHSRLRVPAEAIHGLGKTGVIHEAAAMLGAIPHSIFALNRVLEQQAQVTALGRYVRRDIQEFSDSWLKSVMLQDQAIQDAAHGFFNTAHQRDAAKFMDHVLGQYSRFSPKLRATIQTLTPFLPWYLNAARFVFWTLPVNHPVKTALLQSAEVAFHDDWKRQHAGLFPGSLQAAVPRKGGGYRDLARFSPFGAFTEVAGGGDLSDWISLAYPQLQGAIHAGMKQDPFGRPLQVPKTGKNPEGKATQADMFKAIANNLLGSILPYYAPAERVAQHGETAYGNSSLLFGIHTKPGTSHGYSGVQRWLDPFRPVFVGGNAGGDALPQGMSKREIDLMKREADGIAASQRTTPSSKREAQMLQREADRLAAAAKKH